MRNPKLLKTGPEFYKTQIFLEDSLLILTNIQTWDNYRLYSQDLANLVHENIGFNFKTVYQMFRFWTRFLPESRKCWRVFLIILCLILYEIKHQRSHILRFLSRGDKHFKLYAILHVVCCKPLLS